MADPNRVSVDFTPDEAYEVLMRCLQSDEPDNPVFASAIRRLAKAVGRAKPDNENAA